MKRAIVDYKKLTKDILALLVEKYPEGYQDRDVIRFKNAKNETVEALEVRTEDTIYLVKVSTRLASTMERYDEDDDDYYYGEGIQTDTLEMTKEDELALKHKKDISKTSSRVEEDDDEDYDDDEEDEDYNGDDEDDDDEDDDNQDEDDDEEDED
ncbi:DNA primase [uncultured Capnocytophaga sp.]|uniref:DNA primase n=1 Tax=uncultured Capnocytophaga sp. TaxID=159273 RepID=UPI002621E974|nr:DNA primase [uncultured Capnocytophaga sp.]